MSDRRLIRFTPSVYTRLDTYGSNYGQAEMPPTQPAPTSKPIDPAKLSSYVDIGISALSTLIGSKSERESVAEIEAKIQIAEYNKLHPSFLTFFTNWDKELIRLRARLEAAKSLAADEEAAAEAAKWRDVGYTVLVFGGVLVVLGVAANQFAKAKQTTMITKQIKQAEE